MNRLILEETIISDLSEDESKRKFSAHQKSIEKEEEAIIKNIVTETAIRIKFLIVNK